jgi:Zn-finger nucleic acid-binding protein
MHCHRCNRELKQVKKGDITLYICPSCNGIALSNEELKKLISLSKNLVNKDISITKKVDIMKYSKQKLPLLKCPNCNYNLYVIENKALELDYCLNCKTFWFDEGELKSFIDRCKSGRTMILESSQYVKDDILNLIFSFI